MNCHTIEVYDTIIVPFERDLSICLLPSCIHTCGTVHSHDVSLFIVLSPTMTSQEITQITNQLAE